MKIDYKCFLDKVFANLNGVGIDVSNFKLDHVAYRTNDINRYNELKSEFSETEEFLEEVTIYL